MNIDTSIEIKQYAPVLIPTLNRFSHFKNCLESLEHCSWAEFTDVFVALDYPPSPQYRDGWMKIDNYLKGKESKHGFKSLNVIRRTSNCGLHNKGGNFTLLLNEVMKTYDRYIFTEDDNYFSPCFLEYMNKALTFYENDDRIFQICGYDRGGDKSILENDSFYLSNYTCAWGFGRWKNRRDYFRKNYMGLQNVRRMLDDKDIRSNMKLKCPSRIYSYVDMLRKGICYGDVIQTTFLLLEEKYNVFPSMSLVRNIGTDGTGEHKGTASQQEWYSHQPIDTSDHFEFIGNGRIVDAKEVDLGIQKTWKNYVLKILGKFELYLYDSCGILLKSKNSK